MFIVIGIPISKIWSAKVVIDSFCKSKFAIVGSVYGVGSSIAARSLNSEAVLFIQIKFKFKGNYCLNIGSSHFPGNNVIIVTVAGNGISDMIPKWRVCTSVLHCFSNAVP